jgi:hypothetical protein
MDDNKAPLEQRIKNYVTARHVTYYVLGVIEVILGFRFLFRLLGANPNNPFVSFLYSLTSIFLTPFEGIFSEFISPGLEAESVFEFHALIAMLVYAVIFWGIAALINLKIEREKIEVCK